MSKAMHQRRGETQDLDAVKSGFSLQNVMTDSHIIDCSVELFIPLCGGERLFYS